MTRLFFLVSGEHPTLPYAEIRAILESEDIPYNETERLPQILRLNSSASCVQKISSRSSLTRVCCLEIFRCKADKQSILKHAFDTKYDKFINSGQTFAVRIRRVQRSSPHLDIEKIEGEVGGIILNKKRGIKVRLASPDKTFFGALTDENFVFGLKLAEVSPKPFTKRRPKNRPFFHPSALPPKLARFMVNLARPKVDSVVLDPFCGSGSILIEAGLIGCRVLGSDVRDLMARGGLLNMRFFGVKALGISVAEAGKLPFRRVDRIVTDPPYGKSTTTLGFTIKEIVSRFLSEAIDILPEGGYVSMASPRNLGISEIGENEGFKVIEKHLVYVHRSLTRELIVFKKV